MGMDMKSYITKVYANISNMLGIIVFNSKTNSNGTVQTIS